MNIEPLPLETELRLEHIRRHLTEMTKEELIHNFSISLDTLTRMTHQTKQLLVYIEFLESKEQG